MILSIWFVVTFIPLNLVTITQFWLRNSAAKQQGLYKNYGQTPENDLPNNGIFMFAGVFMFIIAGLLIWSIPCITIAKITDLCKLQEEFHFGDATTNLRMEKIIMNFLITFFCCLHGFGAVTISLAVYAPYEYSKGRVFNSL